ncbi:Methionine ABC transporter ATP-binding protein [Brachybacterium faecium]|uniref:ABC-type antimicrobial peptide transport system, ATPase component n=1 Tax=Brachybacterium faecium (strain ATCC 43885 / DSM 4810 / JCM 11609 / LMG 19847 / NBRC 14762 / NCIMB 9860 / 6-10) TaxID=446465 RepID=C7ME47_BRAFD|nr:ABC transporter ATP-binding protein [Brachybacterium faecium]ACU85854.1 ABC-type antimicrobial peptide transport system, ATPase component [Brachybacterium faecium DSM 4810]SLM98216.1 Methionine ABC transporter ATP-binding protein [Brachybacterium faecium]
MTTAPLDARPSPADSTAPAVVARGVTRTYGSGAGSVTALDAVDLDISRGAFTAIMGPSGSGKSTLLHILAGLDVVDSGSILLDGTEITALGDDALTKLRREKIGFVFQSFNLLPMLTAEQNILLPLELAGTRADRAWLETIASAFGITDRLSHLPSQLSGGQVQRVAISRALVTSPAVVFADEPTGNLDSRTTEEVLDFLRLSVDEFHQTVVMVTHERDAAERADRIITLADGRVASDEDLRGQR